MMFLDFSHSELVEIAYRWILKSRGCGVAFKELKSHASEIPDVIGFGSGASIVIECKASRSDFFNDKNKPHRSKGMGIFRYYCVPTGLVSVQELPPKWGLIYVNEDTTTKVIKDPRKSYMRQPDDFVYGEDNYWVTHYTDAFSNDIISEQKIMYTALRRLQLKGYMTAIYDKNNNRQQ